MNSTNVGGRVVAWVANRIRGCFPPRTGGGVAATTSLRNVFSRPVEIPHAPNHDIHGDLTTVDGPSGGAPTAEGVPTADRYAGIFTLEVLSPTADSAIDGFNVPFCGASIDAIPYGQISVGMIYRF